MKLDTIKDKSNPQSLVNVCPQVLAERIKAIPDDVINLSLKELEKIINVTEDDEMMRVAFSQEVERARRIGKPVHQTNIYEGIITAVTWAKYINNSFKLSYIIHPFAEYETSLENILQLGLNQMKKIMKRDLVTEDGKFDYKLAQIQVQLFNQVADRTRGTATQKIDMKSQSLSLSVTKNITESSREIPMDIDRQLQELEAQTSNEVRTLAYEEKEIQEADVISEEEGLNN